MPAVQVAPQRGHSLDEGPSALNPSDRAFWIGLSLVLLSLVSAFATYLILTGLTPITPRNEVVLTVLALNIVLIIAMIALLDWQIIGLARAWRQRTPGARLHIRIVALFSIIAALPTLLLAVGATVTFSRSLDGWFATSTRAIVLSSRDVANAYLDEHGAVIRTDIVNMARDLDMAAAIGRRRPAPLPASRHGAGRPARPAGRLHHRRRRRARHRDQRRQPASLRGAADERAGPGGERPGARC